MCSLMLAACVGMALAQKGLAVNELFGKKYTGDKQAVVTSIHGSSLTPYDLSRYKSLTISNRSSEAEVIEPLLAQDAEKAIDSETSYRDGKLYYAFYYLPPYDGEFRYLFYLNQSLVGKDKIILMYLQGCATQKEVKKLLKTK